jgi:predicted dehydrogenase
VNSIKTKSINLSVIGCGRIAEFHIPAMKDAGFNIVSIAGSLNSKNVHDFSIKHKIPKFYLNPSDLIENSSEWEALLILSPVSTMVSYLEEAIIHGKPILVEKPVALNHLSLSGLIDYSNIRVAFNRRFYSGASLAKNFIKSHPNSVIKVTIPESRLDPNHNINFPEKLPLNSYENSVHIYDLINFICGGVKWETTKVIKTKEMYIGFTASGVSSNSEVIHLDSFYNSPENFSINVISGNQRLEMKPLEVTSLYQGMVISEPSEEMPIRVYKPLLKDQIIDIPINGHKPGFLEQANDFMKFCIKRKDCIGADIRDAYNALKLVQNVIK